MLHSPGSSRVPFLLAGQASRSALWKEQLKKHTLARSLHDRMQFFGLSLGSAAGTRHILRDDGLHGGCWQAGGEFAVSPKASPPARWAPCPARCRMAMYCSVSLHPGTASLSEPSGNRNVRGKSKKLCAC